MTKRAGFKPMQVGVLPVSTRDNVDYTKLKREQAKKPWTLQRLFHLLLVLLAGCIGLAGLGYCVYTALMLGYFDQSVAGKTMVIYSMEETPFTLAQGMFADWIAVVGALHYGAQHQAAGVRVEYNNPWYVDPEKGPNWWAYFFEPHMTLDASVVDPPETFYNHWLARYGKVGSFSAVVKVPEEGAVAADDLYAAYPYPINGALSLDEVRVIVKDNIRVKPEISLEVDEIRTGLGIDEDTFLIGIHYRGTDKVINFPFKRPPMHYFEFYVKEVLALYQPEKYKIFVATDSSDFITFAKEIWNESELVFISDSPRLSDSDTKAQGLGLHRSSMFSAYKKAHSAVIDMLMLSRCSYIIKNRSSLSDTALALGGEIPFTYFMTEDFPVYNSDPRLGQYTS